MILNSSIRDNKNRGSVGDFLKTNITKNSNLAIVSAYFMIYPFQKIGNELNSIKNLVLTYLNGFCKFDKKMTEIFLAMSSVAK